MSAPRTDLADWLLTKEERGNPRTRLDEQHPGQQAWSEGNLVRPLIHGSTYFAELYERIEATRPGDLVFFTDWQGDADERLTGEPGSEVAEVLGRADERGVDVRGLVWRSHKDAFGFTAAREPPPRAATLQKRGAEALLDMRIRLGGSHHQKMVVIRHRDDPTRDVAYVGGIDLCHSRRDDADHGGDPQAQQNLARGVRRHPAVARHPGRHQRAGRVRRGDRLPGALGGPHPADPQPVAASSRTGVLRMDIDPGPDAGAGAAAPAGRGRHARRPAAAHLPEPPARSRLPVRPRRRAQRRPRLHQGREARPAADLRRGPVPVGAPRRRDLHRGAPRPPRPARHRRDPAVPRPHRRARPAARSCSDGGGRSRRCSSAAPDRVAVYGIENRRRHPGLRARQGLRHRRHLGLDRLRQLQPAVLDARLGALGGRDRHRRGRTTATPAGCGSRSPPSTSTGPADDDCVDAAAMFAAYAECADRARRLARRRPRRPAAAGPAAPDPAARRSGRLQRALALPAYLVLHDPDGRPGPLRKRDEF